MKIVSALAKFAAAISLLGLLASCAKDRSVNSAQDIPENSSVVVLQAFEEPPQGLFKNGRLAIYFGRFDPPMPRTGFWANGTTDEYLALAVPPGRYQFSFFQNSRVMYMFEPHNARYEIEIRPNEAVYIGNVVEEVEGTRFRIDIRDTEDAARAFFEKKLPGSPLPFRKRLMQRVMGLNPLLPR